MTSVNGYVPRLLRGSALKVTNQVAQALVAFFLTPFVIRSLGDQRYGLWTLLCGFIGYYGLLDMGLSASVVRHLSGSLGARNRQACDEYFVSALALYSGIGLLALAISMLLGFSSGMLGFSAEDARTFRWVVFILGTNAALHFPVVVFDSVIVAELRYDVSNMVSLLSLLLRTGLTVVVLLHGGQLISLSLVALLAQLPAYAFRVFYGLSLLPGLRLHWLGLAQSRIRELASFSAYVFLGQLANQLRFHLDYVVITFSIGLIAVTHYKIASMLILHANMLVRAFSGVTGPLFSRLDGADERSSIEEVFMLSTRVSVALSTFVCFGFVVWGKRFIGMWMGPSYLDAYPCLLVLAVGTWIMMCQGPSINLLVGVSHHRFPAFLNLGEGVANLAISLLLVRPLGIVGVALGTCIPMTVCKLIIQPAYTAHVLNLSYAGLLLRMGRTLLSAGGSLVLPLLLSLLWVRPNMAFLLGQGLLCLVLYTAGLWLLELSAAEKKWFLGYMRAVVGPFARKRMPLLWQVLRQSD